MEFFSLSTFWDKMGLEIISDDHLHVVKENQAFLDSNVKIIVFHRGNNRFLKGFTQDHSQTVSSKFFSQCIILPTPGQPDSQSVSQ